MKTYDDLINKYLDNELTESELTEFSEMLKTNPDFEMQVKAMQKVEDIIKEIPEEKTSDDFTNNLLKKIYHTTIVKRKENLGYFKFVISLFVTGLIAILGYVFYVTGAISKLKVESNLADSYVDKFNSYFNLDFLNIFKKNSTVELITAFLIVVLMSAIYISYETYKNYKRRAVK